MPEVDTISVKDGAGVSRDVPTILSLEDTFNLIFGALNATKTTDPDAASANLLGLLRGILNQLQDSTDPVPITATGTSNHRLLSAAATTNATNVKASAGKVYKLMGKVARTSDVYLKLYNDAGTPDETDTPTHTIALPANGYFDLDLNGYAFSAGIAYRMVTAGADNSTAALTAGDVLGFNLSYT